jgi:hypothetical protein
MFHDPADRVPEPQSSGDLVPPPRHPPTALATATQPPRPPLSPTAHEPPALLQLLGRAIDRVLDVADDVADTVASASGLGPRRGA